MIWLRALASRPALMIVAALGGAFALGLVQRGCSPPPPPPEVGRLVPESPRTEPARDTRDAPQVVTPPPPQIIVIRPDEKDRARIAGEIQRPDLARAYTEESIEAARRLGVITPEEADAALASYRAEQERLAKENAELKRRNADLAIQFERELVARRAIPPSPWGGTATATLNRVTGRVDVDYARRARPRVNWLWDFGVGGRFQWQDTTVEGLVADESTAQQEARAFLFVDPVEFGRRFPTRLRLDAGWSWEEIGAVRLDGPFVGIAVETHFNADRRINAREEE